MSDQWAEHGHLGCCEKPIKMLSSTKLLSAITRAQWLHIHRSSKKTLLDVLSTPLTCKMVSCSLLLGVSASATWRLLRPLLSGSAPGFCFFL